VINREHEDRKQEENHEGIRLHEGHEDDNHEGSRSHEGHEDGKHEGIRSHEGHEDDKHEGIRSHAGHEDGKHEGIRLHEGHEDNKRRGLRISSPLSDREEQAISKAIGCALAVHRELGPGFLESIYKRAMLIELNAQGIAFEAERSIRVTYKGIEIPGQRVDLIIEGLVVVELKTITRFDSIHVAQVLSYLKTLNLRGGLLVNFTSPLLRSGLKRVVR
jgi:GxxExxY protein